MQGVRRISDDLILCTVIYFFLNVLIEWEVDTSTISFHSLSLKFLPPRHFIFHSHSLTDDLPNWSVGDVFGDREYIRETLRQYAVLPKRDIHIKVNNNKKVKSRVP